MLVLTRKIGEEIIIDGAIRIKLCDVCGARVRLAIAAPPHVPVYRAEIAGRINSEAGDEKAGVRDRELSMTAS